MATGEWPDHLIGYKDGNPRNLAWSNLKAMATEDRVEHFKQVGDILDQKPTQTAPVRRASFTPRQVRAAVEEYLKNKTLVNGRYESIDY